MADRVGGVGPPMDGMGPNWERADYFRGSQKEEEYWMEGGRMVRAAPKIDWPKPSPKKGEGQKVEA